jgi:putative transposase
MADQLYSARPIGVLTTVDGYSRESLALKVGLRLTGDDVVEVLGGVIRERGVPASLRVDNAPEFTSRVLDQWAYWNGAVWTSSGLASRRTTRSWRLSTAGSGSSA